MAKILRKNQTIFGLTSGANQISQFGSLAAAAPVYSLDPDIIQALPEFAEGWFGAVLGSNAPAIEDENALNYLWSYQLAYLFQAGVPEWNSATTYYSGSIVNSSGILYRSLQNANLNNVVTDTTWWVVYNAKTEVNFTFASSWTAPVGVTEVTVQAIRKARPFSSNGLRNISIGATANPLVGSPQYYSIGFNANGQLGDGTVVAKSSPVLLAGSQVSFRKVLGGQCCYGLGDYNQSGGLYAWGINSVGQLGLGDLIPRSSPVAVTFTTPVQNVFSLGNNNGGAASAYIVDFAGNAYATGANTKGELGDGTVVGKSVFTAVVGGVKFSTVSLLSFIAGGSSAYALTAQNTAVADGLLYAWGDNQNGQLGVGDTVARSSPVAVLGGLTVGSVVTPGALGIGSALVLTTAGLLYGIGDNTDGQLGIGSVLPKSSPVAVVGGLTFKKVLMAGTSSYGLTSAGALYAWGLNTIGQLGDGTTVAKSSPVAVLGGHVFKDFVLNYDGGAFTAVLGLTEDGDLYSWGSNGQGELGDGTTVAKSSPVLVLGSQKWVAIGTTLGINAPSFYAANTWGQAYAWGDNADGQLGLGGVVARSSPVAILRSLPVNCFDIVFTQTFKVVPGQSYAIRVGAGTEYALFGTNLVGQGRCSDLKIIYEA